MVVRPKLSLLSDIITAPLPILAEHRSELVNDPKELYREVCTDDEDNRYVVIVWRKYPNLSVTEYTLEDGRLVKFVDDCLFEIVDTGTIIAREG